MWKRSTLLLTCLKSPRLLVEQNRSYCDIKTNVELLFTNSEKPTIPSNFQIKKSIKSLPKYEMVDGFACIQTKCPICVVPPTEAVAKRSNIYVNKTSGESPRAERGRNGVSNVMFNYSRRRRVSVLSTHLQLQCDSAIFRRQGILKSGEFEDARSLHARQAADQAAHNHRFRRRCR